MTQIVIEQRDIIIQIQKQNIVVFINWKEW
jgi:hypothetical protein